MPTVHFYQGAFSAGELSPRLDARTDAKRYKLGLSLLVNGIVRVQGGIERRPGTRYVNATKFSAKRSHLIPFEFSDVQAYSLEFGDQYIRFFANGGFVIDPTELVTNGTFDANITSWTNKSTGTGSIAWNAGQYMDIAAGAAGTGWAEQNVAITTQNVTHRLTFTVKPGGTLTMQMGTATGTSNILAPVSYPAGTYVVTFTPAVANVFVQFLHSVANATYGLDSVSIRKESYEIASPYLEADVASLRWVQSADTLFLVHPTYAPRKLVRSGATNWALSTITFVDGPYLDPNTDTTKKLTSSVTAVGATGTLTATGHTPFVTGHVGSFWRLTVGSTTGYVRVDSFTSSTVVNITVMTLLGGTTATSNWQEGAWSDYRGWPRVVTLHEDRLWFAANSTKPQTVWATKTSDWVNFTPGANAADPITATISSNKVNVVRWLQPAQVLLCGTLGDEFAIASVGTGAIQPNSIQVKRQTSHGSANFDPVAIGSSVLFVQRSGKRLREMSFDFNTDAYIAQDLSLLAEHVFRAEPVIDLAVQREPDQIVWAVRNDGYLLGLTYDKNEDVIAWHRHVTSGVIESVCVIPHPNGDRDQVWVIVNRTINGSTKRFVEVFEDVDGFYETYELDCALQYVGAPVAAVSGLTHLIGETVDIMGDGAVHPSQVVDANGSVPLQRAASVVEVGLPYATTIATMRPDIPVQDGTSQMRQRRFGTIQVRLIDSLGGAVNGELIDYRVPSDSMDEAPPLFTGVKNITSPGGWDQDGIVTIVQDQPLPLEVLAIAGDFTVEGTTRGA